MAYSHALQPSNPVRGSGRDIFQCTELLRAAYHSAGRFACCGSKRRRTMHRLMRGGVWTARSENPRARQSLDKTQAVVFQHIGNRHCPAQQEGTAAGRPIQLAYAPKAVQEFIRKSLVSDNLEIADRPINQLHIAEAGMADAPGVVERPLRDFLQDIARSGMEI